ncbi:MAG: hypothetical protein K0R80_1513 [Clostridia bacterium]|nr:hypothetical protein [Clostridia bacterium]
MKTKNYIPVSQAILAAALFGMSAPFSKFLLREISPLMLSALLYLGAGIGMFIIDSIRKISKAKLVEARLTKQELPFVLLMVMLDIAAPIALMFGLTMTTSSNAALLNNFEIAATSVIALIVFKEAISRRLWLSISLITISSIILSIEDYSSSPDCYNKGYWFRAWCFGYCNFSSSSIMESCFYFIITPSWIFCLWPKHIFLCNCTEKLRRSQNKRLLRHCSIYRGRNILYALP